jgi:predicted AlkP superfamily pyrophosphatase or phosphodiesterase
MNLKRTAAGAIISLLATALVPRAFAGAHGHKHFNHKGISHVLLISIDGMHALDFANCAAGTSGVNGGKPYCPHLAPLMQAGVNYVDATTSRPSDSFPGLMAIVSGGSPRTVGAFYDVAYDRSCTRPNHW